MNPDRRRALAALYRDTDYCVDVAPAPLVLAVDVRSDGLVELMRTRAIECAALVTACNPHGRVLADADNAARMRRLRAELGEAGFGWLEGKGRARDGSHAEPSLLVFALDLEAAHALMRRFEQNAFLWIGADAVPRLEWTKFD